MRPPPVRCPPNTRETETTDLQMTPIPGRRPDVDRVAATGQPVAALTTARTPRSTSAESAPAGRDRWPGEWCARPCCVNTTVKSSSWRSGRLQTQSHYVFLFC